MLFFLDLYTLLNLRVCEHSIEMAGPLEERVTFCSTVGQEGLYYRWINWDSETLKDFPKVSLGRQ